PGHANKTPIFAFLRVPSRIKMGALDPTLLPLYYTLFGASAAFGVGKVGAYTNYFLEFYAGLIWLAASVALLPAAWDGDKETRRQGDKETRGFLKKIDRFD